jgi:hypothetical protein
MSWNESLGKILNSGDILYCPSRRAGRRSVGAEAMPNTVRGTATRTILRDLVFGRRSNTTANWTLACRFQRDNGRKVAEAIREKETVKRLQHGGQARINGPNISSQ